MRKWWNQSRRTHLGTIIMLAATVGLIGYSVYKVAYFINKKILGLEREADKAQSLSDYISRLGKVCKRVSVFALIIVVVLTISPRLDTTKKTVALQGVGVEASDTLKARVQDNVLKWVTGFVDKDYSTCNALVQSSMSYVIKSDGKSNTQFYGPLVDHAVDNIKSVKVLGTEELEEGTYETSVEFTYVPYKKIDNLVINKEGLTKLKKDYIDSTIESSVLEQELDAVYYDVFMNSCFVQKEGGSELEESVVVTFTTVGTYGVYYIYQTREAIQSILDVENLTYNIGFYEDTIQDTVEDCLVD